MSTKHWVRFTHQGSPGFGWLQGEQIAVCQGDMFGAHQSTGPLLPLAGVQISIPCVPSKFIGLWNNYHAQAAKQGLNIPAEPLWFIKAASSYCAHGQPFSAPAS